MAGKTMKRFYKEAGVSQEGDGWAVVLDGRVVKTPAQKLLSVHSKALALALAGEWDRQGDEVDIQGMHLTRLVNVAIDRTGDQRAGMVDELVKYCQTDLLSFLAEGPADLVDLQIVKWRPVREWVGEEFGIVLEEVRIGLVGMPQPPDSLKAARTYADGLDDLRLTGLNFGLGLYGSALLSIAVCAGHISAPEAYELSILDETFQIGRWGQDEENLIRLNNNRAQAEALGHIFRV